MERGTYPAKAMHQDLLFMEAGAVGAGASILTNALPTDANWPLQVRDNFYSSNTRTSAGLFVLTLKEMPPVIIEVLVTVHNTAGTALRGQARSYSLTAKTVTIDIRDGAGAVADPTTGDYVRVTVIGRETTVGSSV